MPSREHLIGDKIRMSHQKSFALFMETITFKIKISGTACHFSRDLYPQWQDFFVCLGGV